MIESSPARHLSELDPASSHPAGFIELMETGEGSELFRKHHILVRFCVTSYCVAAGSTNYVKQRRSRASLLSSGLRRRDWPFMPYEKDFCATCNRLRVSSAVNSISACLVKAALTCAICWKRYPATGAGSAYFSGAAGEEKTHFLHQNNTGITQNLSYIGAKTSKGEIR